MNLSVLKKLLFLEYAHVAFLVFHTVFYDSWLTRCVCILVAEAADLEVSSSGRQLAGDQDQPSTAAYKLQMALNELTAILQKSLYR